MTRREMNLALAASGAVVALGGAAAAAESSTRALPPASELAGVTLKNALKLRRSTRAYTSHPLPDQVLSDILWAANGVNRPNDGRTSPYWRHIMVIDIYLAMADGIWFYDPPKNALRRTSEQDIRAQTGQQDFVSVAPLELIYVAHGERMTDVNPEERRLYASVDAGFIGQNVYLACAAAGLGSVFRGSVDAARVARLMQLPDSQFVTFAQTVGYPVS